MPIEQNKIELRIGHVGSAWGNSQMIVTLEVSESGTVALRLHMHDPTSRRGGELLMLGEEQYRDLLTVLHATHQTIERMRASGQLREFKARLP
ncbi:hypothetical protein [Pendulispora albinea]|uniref:Uncharacterized protein n=1 Tax=Pendulispora albinea TaxID=2741071 RepID=A0ABZ2LS76_9BACT